MTADSFSECFSVRVRIHITAVHGFSSSAGRQRPRSHPCPLLNQTSDRCPIPARPAFRWRAVPNQPREQFALRGNRASVGVAMIDLRQRWTGSMRSLAHVIG